MPAAIRYRDRQIGVGDAVLTRYERITFEKSQIGLHGKPLAEFVCPGHPLLESVSDIILERYRGLLKSGAILVDDADPGRQHAHSFISSTPSKTPARILRVIDALFRDKSGSVEIDSTDSIHHAGYAPYLDYRPLDDNKRKLVEGALAADWLQGGVEDKIFAFAAETSCPVICRR